MMIDYSNNHCLLSDDEYKEMLRKKELYLFAFRILRGQKRSKKIKEPFLKWSRPKIKHYLDHLPPDEKEELRQIINQTIG